MIVYIDIETLRSSEEHRLEILKDVQDNFKAPSNLTKTQAAIDLGLTDKNEIKFTSACDMILRWEKELAEEKSVDVAQKKWEKTSFNPDVSEIACINIDIDDKKVSFNTINQSEKSMLQEFHKYLINYCSANNRQVKTPFFVGHNILSFDLPFIFKRSVINDVKQIKNVTWINARHGQSHFDTMIAWAGFGKRISADNLAKLLKIKGKGDIDGSMVYDEWQKDPQKVVDYCHDDVRIIKQIHERLTK